jgi:hypothetical protein
VAQTGLIGAAGEYLVAAELSRRGWLATVTVKNAPGTDVLAQHFETGHVIAIQTKTTTGNDSFVLGAKDETPTRKTNEWVALVRLGKLHERATFWLIPRNHVAALLWVEHKRWLAVPGRGGRVHKDNPIRNIRCAEVDPYLEGWHWLTSPTSRIPYGLPDWFEREVPTYGLPPGHPDAKRFAVAPASP